MSIDIEKLQYECLMELASVDAYETNLRDNPDAYKALDRFAALVLEQAAMSFDDSPNADMFRQDIADAIRSMKPKAE